MSKVLIHTRIADGLVGYWPLNGNSNDLIGGNNGTDTDITYIAGKVKECASFNGGTSQINLSSTISILNLATATVSCWFKASSFPLVIFTGTPSSTPYICAINSTQLYTAAAGGVSSSTFTFTFTTGTWYHVIQTFDNGVLRAYVNSVESVTGAVNATDLGNYNISIFGGYNSGFDINGEIDEIAIWNRALSEYEIKRLYNGGNGFKLLNA